jgi:hypothetical protein
VVASEDIGTHRYVGEKTAGMPRSNGVRACQVSPGRQDATRPAPTFPSTDDFELSAPLSILASPWAVPLAMILVLWA